MKSVKWQTDGLLPCGILGGGFMVRYPKKLILKGVMVMGELEVDVGVLKERVDNMEKTQDGLIKKLDVFQNTLMVTLGGVIVNLIVLLIKK
jgi:hypothetical protein